MNSAVANDGHTTVHAYDYRFFVAGCICGWVGEKRTTFQTVVADQIAHVADASTDDEDLP